ncbi:YihY/virulence factor BrkB family protein [Lysobacter pythonis]|uniref:YihY/virulence factor BrkB family protein n=1 Tax=Solilutibacter pythonis TaxID=2483112 RepID=A0A3M2HH29_9GAMM|nr:YihY/virulence factor BrkB family protein [Lysobacter pythonis]RMH89026.1 YihY/virulence factor BrkB family protein [Lysobacter pythonis]
MKRDRSRLAERRSLLREGIARARRSLPAEAAERFIELDLLTHAAALAFYALLSLAPLLLLLLWLTASLYPEAQAALLGQIYQLAGNESRAIAATVLHNATSRPDIGSFAGWWSTLLLFIGATVVFARLQGTLNLIFHSDARALGGPLAWLRKRVFSFGVVFALGFLLLLSVTVTTALQFALAGLPALLPFAGNIGALLVYTLAFALLYQYLPDRRVGWRQSLIGGTLTAALFVVGRQLIGLYIVHAAPGSAYGSMGTLVLMLVWVYYAAVVFFCGALLTAIIDERRCADG